MSITKLTFSEKRKLATLEVTIQRGLKYYIEVGDALLTIRDDRLYRGQYSSFEEYCLGRWRIKRNYANKLIAASEVAENLQGTFVPLNEAQARPLTTLQPDEQRIVWEAAKQTVGEGKLTADHIETIVATFKQFSETTPIEQITSEQIVKVVKPNYKRDVKASRAADEYTPQGFDACQTPAHALDPLLPYLNVEWVIWECAAGEGLLAEGLYDSGMQNVVRSDILTGQNFFEYEPEQWDCIVTNPPFSLKFRWLQRCYALNKPFALLLPVEVLGAKTAQEMFRDCGIEVIFVDKRINFKMPHKGWDGAGAQFPVAWFTYGLNIGQQMTFARFDNGND